MENQTLIFIPDISGFTEFVNNTAIEHSQHIISELLEIVIESNKLDFSISEIEGDAILFYKMESIPRIDEIIDQTKEMFINFHSHLDVIDKTTVCQCGACKTASNLTLKFIVHLGEIKEVSINKFNKLIGSDLILAHRLLKNNIDSKEYLLLSEAYFKNYGGDKDSLEKWIDLKSTLEKIDNFGEIKLKYIDFKPLSDQLPQILEENKPIKHTRNPDILTFIKAPILFVHHALTDVNVKYEFVKGLKKLVSDDKINRINSSHTCVFDNLEIHFVTKNNAVEGKDIFYSEEASLKQGFRFITDYQLIEKDGGTELAIHIFRSKQSNVKETFIGKIKNYFMLKFIIISNKKGIKHFKDYCEKKFSKENLKEYSI